METDVTEKIFNESSDCIQLLNHHNTSNIVYSINDNLSFAFHGIGISLLTIFGISTNVLSVIVLTHPKLKSSLTTLLLGLTISDIFVIGTAFLIFSLSVVLDRIQVFSYYSTYLRPHLLPWLLPVALTAQMSSVYFTVVITLERYIAVCHPLKARSLCTRSTAKKLTIIIVILSLLYNIPRWFEFRTVPKVICGNLTEYGDSTTAFRRNPTYLLYYINWAYLVFLYLAPFTILVYFNIVIYSVTKLHRSRRNSLSPTRTNNSNEDIQLAGMLLGIVITFLLCNMPALVVNLMESFGMGDIANLLPINNFLIICSCSSNFIFYFAFGTQFRRRLKRTLGISQKWDPRKNSNISYHVGSEYTSTMSTTTVHQRDQQSFSPNVGITPSSSNDKNNNGGRDGSERLPSCSRLEESSTDGLHLTRLSDSQLTVQTII